MLKPWHRHSFLVLPLWNTGDLSVACLSATGCLTVCSPREGQKRWVSMVGHRHPAWWGRNALDMKNPSWKTKDMEEGHTFLPPSYGLLPGVHQPPQLVGHNVHVLCRFLGMPSPCQKCLPDAAHPGSQENRSPSLNPVQKSSVRSPHSLPCGRHCKEPS